MRPVVPRPWPGPPMRQLRRSMRGWGSRGTEPFTSLPLPRKTAGGCTASSGCFCFRLTSGFPRVRQGL
jgi:hypothetical protein